MRLFGVSIGRKSLRGRVSRVAIVRTGEVSVTVRFGLDELEAAKKMLPGALLEVVEVPEKKPPAPRKRERSQKHKHETAPLLAGDQDQGPAGGKFDD